MTDNIDVEIPVVEEQDEQKKVNKKSIKKLEKEIEELTKQLNDWQQKYALALTFVALITDTQWDVYDAISVSAKIDISKNKFNYKQHRNNAYKLFSILLFSVFVMFIILL